MPVPQRLAFGDFVMEPSQHRVRHRDGAPLVLTPRLFSALQLFAEHPGELLTKDALMLALWPGLVVEENNLSQVVSTLRKALGDDTQGSRYIQTVPRQGFRFVAAVAVLPDDAAATTPAPVAGAIDSGAQAVLVAEPALPRRRWLGAALAGGSALGLGGGA